MHNFMNDLMNICELLEKELSKTNKKLEKAGGQMSMADLDYVDKLTHALKSVKTTKAMVEAEEDGYSFDYENTNFMRRDGRYSRDNMSSMRGSSYARGRGAGAKRDSMGRYSRGEDVVAELHEIMNDVPEHMRGEFKRFIDKMEMM